MQKREKQTSITHRSSFAKNERLFLRNEVQQLFTQGKYFTAFPYRVVYSFYNPNTTCNYKQSNLQLLISVAKKRFRLAVDRNHIKRITREAYRLNINRNILLTALEQQQKHISFAVIFIGKKAPSLPEATKAFNTIFNKLTNEANKVKL